MSDDKPALFRPGIGKRGMTELHYAAYRGDMPGLVRCLDAGMDPNKKDDYRGYTALHWLADMAAVGGPRVDIRITSSNGITALVLAREAGTAGGDALADEILTIEEQEAK
jgi:hypothetical protein